MSLPWDQKRYTTGFADIDEQHRNLFEGLNNFRTFLKEMTSANELEEKKKVMEILDFLGEYVATHFRDEEKIFAKYNHPMAEANKEAHKLFIEQYVGYRDKLAEETLTSGSLIKLHLFLQSWLIKHILKIDTSLRDCAEEAAREAGEGTQDEDYSAKKRGFLSRFLKFFE